MLPVSQRRLIQVWWTDATNVAGGWHDSDDLGEFAVNGAWEASNTGWLVHEDDLCVVLAGRMTEDGRNVGLIERIPKNAITRTVVHAQNSESPESGGSACRRTGVTVILYETWKRLMSRVTNRAS